MANKVAVSVSVLMVIAVAFQTALTDQKVKRLRNLHCSPRPTVVETKPMFYPYFVSLNRCNGSIGTRSPATIQCVPSKTESFKVTLRLGSVARVITMQNHTECKAECALKREDCPYPGVYDPFNCKCDCPHSSPPSDMQQCGPLKSWSKVKCGCVCNRVKKCPKKYIFDESSCSCKCNPKRKVKCESMGGTFYTAKCKCKNIQRQTSENKDHEDSFIGSTTFWIYVLIGEFVFLLFCFDLILCCKKMGLIYKLTSVCRSEKVIEAEPEDKEERSPKEVKVHFNEGCHSSLSSLHNIPGSMQPSHYGEIGQF